MTVLLVCRLILLASIITVLSWIIRQALKGNKEAKTILLGTFVFCLSGAFDIFVGMALPFWGIPPITYIGMLIFMISLLSVMVRRLVSILARLRNSEKLSIAGQLAAGVAHEIRNPVTVLSGFLQVMREKKEDARVVDLMLSEVERINRIVDDFLVLAKPGSTRFKMENPRIILQEVLELFESHASSNGVRIQVKSKEDIAWVNCDKSQLKQVFLNVMKNAVESMPDGGNLYIELRNQGLDVLIRFIDEGSGIERNHMPKLGEPFYTTKADGTGLGLMISHSIIDSHKGKIKLTSKIREGTVVEIRLPAY
jgi:two-component system, sporulation sensor kinase E